MIGEGNNRFGSTESVSGNIFWFNMDPVLGTIVSTINSIITQSADTIVNAQGENDTSGDTTGSVVNETLAKNGTTSVPATPEGMLISCISLALMALFPIVVGSFKSVTHQAKQQVEIEVLVMLIFLLFPSCVGWLVSY